MGILHLHPHLFTGRGTPCQVLVGQRKGRLGIWTTAIHTIELSGSFEATPGSLKAASLGLTCVLTALWNTKGTRHTPGADSLPKIRPVLGLQEQGLAVPPLPSPCIAQAWHMGEEHTHTCLLHYMGMNLAVQPGQPGWW